MRFCQQCGKFQSVSDFEGSQKSCRYRLNLHNAARRRKRMHTYDTVYDKPDNKNNKDTEEPALIWVQTYIREVSPVFYPIFFANK